MALARTILSRRLHSLLETHNPLCVSHIIHSSTPLPHNIPPFLHRPIASLPQPQDLSDPETERREIRTPLVDLFKVPARLPQKAENSESEGKDDPESEKLKKKFRKLEREVRRRKAKSKQGGEAKVREMEGKLRKLKAKSKEDEDDDDDDDEEEGVDKGEEPKKTETKRLHDLFTDQVLQVSESKEEQPKKAQPRRLHHKIAPVEMQKEVKQREPVVLKELSPDMEMLVHYLYREGYFNDANFAKGEKFDLSWFDDIYARNYILFAVRKFSKDKQEISKWLSGSDLKLVAEFGCPSLNRGNVIPAKRLRSFFKIPENTVCSKCMLRDSCEFVNQSVWKSDTNNLDLFAVMKVLYSYAMMSVHPKLVVPDEVKNAVSQLLKEVVKLSQTV